MVDIFKIGLIIPCSGSYDDIVVLNIAIVSVLDRCADGAATFALGICLASISDGLVKTAPLYQWQVSTEVESYLRNRRSSECQYAADHTTRPC